MSYKIAIAGMGKMGQIRKRVLDAHSDFEVVALNDVVDRSADHPDLPFYSQWEKLFEHDLDAICVCTTNDVIPDIACHALRKNIHVFSEKPPGRNVDDVNRIAGQAQESQAQIKFGFNHRFHQSVMDAKQIIDSGRFGNVLWAKGTYGKAGGPEYENQWRSEIEKSGGGILLDQGIHMLDLLRHYLGDFSEVECVVTQSYWKGTELEDNAFAMFQTASGQVATLHSSANYWKNKFLLEIGMEKGMLVLDGILSNSMTYAPELLRVIPQDFQSQQGQLGSPEVETREYEGDRSWSLEIDDFHRAISEGKPPSHGTVDDALALMGWIDKIYQNRQ